MNAQAQLQAAMEAAVAQSNDDSSVASTDQLPGDVNLATDKPTSTVVKFKTLSERAMLTTVNTHTFSPYTRDVEATNDYGAGTVNKHLFAGRDNRVKKLNTLYSNLHSFVRDETVPWAKGVFMMKAMNHPEIMKGVRERRQIIEAQLNDLVNHWDTVVRTDYNRLMAINPKLADWDDYPSDIRSKYGFSIQLMPIPEADSFDPRFGLSEEEKQSYVDTLAKAEADSGKHVLREMMVPMTKLAEHLAKPVEDIKVLRQSLIDNIIGAADRMNRANVCADPNIQQQINSLSVLAKSFSKDTLCHDKTARATAHNDIETLMNKMKGMV